ncbi:MAG TPA: class II glutamine amidotransferase [bacterium]|nr:class II glutamine amidotransferase [bacterium]
MSNFFSLSFDNVASPSVRLKAAGGDPALDWGLVWYAGDDGPASLVRGSGDGTEDLKRALADWSKFRSASFFALSGERQSGKNTPPFLRSYGGRQFVFVFNASLKGDFKSALSLGGDPSFEPLGSSAAEHAFCWLLHQLFLKQARRLSDVPWGELRSWFQQVNELGELNCVLSDGKNQVAYRDREGRGGLYGLRRLPPHPLGHLESEALTLDLGDSMDANRTLYLFSSQPLSGEPWTLLEPGSLRAVRRGRLLYDSSIADVALTRSWSLVGSQGQQTSLLPPPVLGAAAPPRKAYDRCVMNVLHETTYHYRMPVERSRHVLRLRPVQDRFQELLEFNLYLSVDGQKREFQDVFGNATLELDVDKPFTEMVIRASSRVRLSEGPTRWLNTGGKRDTLPTVWMPGQRQMMLPYLLPPELPEAQLKELTEYAMGFAQRNDMDLLDTILDINQTLHDDYAYVSGSTTSETTPYEIYSTRRGVCQDFSNLFICLARLLNLPARYRVGYIYTGGNYENKIWSEASHAWVELFLPQGGWCGFDPTNGSVVGLDHVRVACGRHYLDATPTSGTLFKGGGPEALSVSVKIEMEPPSQLSFDNG